MANSSTSRPSAWPTIRRDPETLLRQVEAEEEYTRRGRLKIFLGYSSGVGKSFRMLDEGRRRRERGEDVVVGAIQPVTPPEVACVLEKLEVIPLRMVDGVPVMDLDTILLRHPQVCLVDGLAYDNPPGSRHAKRWQDVEELLAAGICVVATVNLQHVEERREQVEKITGQRVSQTVPLSFINTADEIEIVDAPPEMCLKRTDAATEAEADGPEGRERLSELREIALLLAADVVDRQLEAYLKHHSIEPLWGVQERILVYVTPEAGCAEMIRSGQRNADRFHGELFVAHVNDPSLPPEERQPLEASLELGRQLGAQVEPLDGEDPIETIMEFARARGITQIFVARGGQENWWDRLWGSEIDRLIQQAEGIDVRVFPNCPG